MHTATFYNIQDQSLPSVNNIIEGAHARLAGNAPVCNHINLCRAQWHQYKPLKLNCINEFRGVFYYAMVHNGTSYSRPLCRLEQAKSMPPGTAFINCIPDFYIHLPLFYLESPAEYNQ